MIGFARSCSSPLVFRQKGKAKMVLLVRRRALLAAPALTLPCGAGATLPAGPIRLVVGFSAGGVDAFARVAARAASETTGRAFLVDNRPGASGTIAAVAVARAAPDGRTVFVGDSGSMTITPEVMAQPPLDPRRDLAPVMLAVISPSVLVCHPAVAGGFDALVARARARPGGLSYASAGPGNTTHLAIADLAWRLGLDLVHVPYRGGGQMATSVIAGETDLCLLSVNSALPHLGAGTLRALAVTTEAPLAELPGVPTVASLVPGAAVRPFWYGFNVAAATPPPVVAALHAAFALALATSAAREAFGPLGIQVVASSPEEYAAFLREETERRAAMARLAGVVPE